MGEVARSKKASTLFREPNAINNGKAREPNRRIQNTLRVGITLQVDATGRHDVQRIARSLEKCREPIPRRLSCAVNQVFSTTGAHS